MLRQLALTAAFVALTFGPSLAQQTVPATPGVMNGQLPRQGAQQPQQVQSPQQAPQPPTLAHPHNGQPPQINLDEIRKAGGGKVDPNEPDQTVEPANGQQQAQPQQPQSQQPQGLGMVPGGLR